jgi:DHA2 family multidrug resistance protein
MIPWEMSRRNPMIDLRMIATRQFGACFLVMLATGAILLGSTNFLPQLVQEDFGYTATWAGLVAFPGGVVMMVMMLVVGRLSGRVQPKVLIIAGALIIALSMYDLTNIYADLGFWFFANSRILFSFGLPLIFVSITTASYDGIPPNKTDQASAMINAGAQHRRLDRRLNCLQCAGASRAVPSEPACRKRNPVERSVPNHAAAGDELLRRPRQLTLPSTTAGRPVDRTAGAESSFVPRLHRRLLGPDGDRTGDGAARARHAQGQARRQSPHGALTRSPSLAARIFGVHCFGNACSRRGYAFSRRVFE